MSSPIIPANGASAPKPVSRTTATAEVAASWAAYGVGGPAPTDQTNASVSLNAFPASPPQDVLDQMDQAAQRYDSLSSQGLELRSVHDAQSGATTFEMRDTHGDVLKRLSLAEALDLAAGAHLE
ncbi:MAG TPA: hypothetical protein VKG38_12050 [Solirubrobacteraceae bacterium]|nr:hypothetical protein [Solirubrobacteraceae bacterium]